MVGIADAGFVCIKSNMRGLGGAHRHRPYRFNIQPPEGGCQPRAAHCTAGRGFNTQPPEGGCDDDAVLVFAIDVSTHNHLKVAGYRAAAVKAVGRVVSTHNHPKVGGYLKISHRFSGSLLLVLIQAYKCGLARFCGDRMRSSSASLNSWRSSTTSRTVLPVWAQILPTRSPFSWPI